MIAKTFYSGCVFCLALVCLLACTISVAVADDLAIFQPSWRGAPGSTYQQWTFDDSNDNPDPADVFFEECPGELTHPTASFSPGTDWGIQYTNREGIRLIDSVHDETITLNIDNCDICNPYKEIWMQVTYFVGDFYGDGREDSEPIVSALVGCGTVEDLSSNQTQVVESADWGDWIVELYKFHIEPNPFCEQIVLSAPGVDGHCKFDQIVVDTICAPEPAMLSLLCVGGLMLLGITRRRIC